MRNSLILASILVVCLASSALAGNGRCGGYVGGGYTGSIGCGSSYYSGIYYGACAPTYRVYRPRVYYGPPVYRSCAPRIVYYHSGCGTIVAMQSAQQSAVQKIDEPKPPAPGKSSPLPPEPKPAVEKEELPKPPKEAFDTTFNIRIKQPNGEMLTVRVKQGFVPQIKTINGKRYAIYDARIPFAKYKKMYERDGYLAYVRPKSQHQHQLVAAR